MAVSNVTNTIEELGDGSIVAFDFPFKIFQASDLKVFKNNGTTLVATLQTLTTDYTVSIKTADEGEGGTVTYVVAPTDNGAGAGENSFIKRELAYTQQTDVPTEGNLPEDSLNNEYDRSRMIDIQLDETLNRSIKFAETSALSDIDFPESTSAAARASKVLAWNGAGDDLELVTIVDTDSVLPIGNPGDIIQGGSGGDPEALAVGGNHEVLSVFSGDGKASWGPLFKKGENITAAGTLPIDTDGNAFDIDGSTTITSFSGMSIGDIVLLQFNDALTLTHHATNLVLPYDSNITTVAGDIALFYCYDTDNVRLVSYFGESPSVKGVIVQMVNTQDGEAATTTTVMPGLNYDTKPVITEGGEFMTLSITPKKTTNKLRVDVVVNGNESTSVSTVMTAALFETSIHATEALAAGQVDIADHRDIANQVCFSYWVTAPSTSTLTFRVRAGMNAAGTFNFNGGQGAAGGRQLGGALTSSITITEIAG